MAKSEKQLKHILKLNASKIGTKHSEETRRKIRRAVALHPSTGHTGKKHSEKAKRKIAEKAKDRKHTDEWKKQNSERMKGSKHWNWQGGITGINFQIRNSFEYKLWRTAVFERDSFTCVWCGDKGGKGRGKSVILHADHIKPFSLFPELRLAIDNGRTLCYDCHIKSGTWGGLGKDKKKLLYGEF